MSWHDVCPTRVIAAVLLSVSTSGCADREPPVDAVPVGSTPIAVLTDSIRMLEQQWADAIRGRDAAALDRLMASDFVLAGTDTTEPAVAREVWMGNTLERLVVDSIRISPAEVHFIGDTAEARLHFVWAGTFNAAITFHDSTMLTDRWVRGPAGWQVHRRTTED